MNINDQLHPLVQKAQMLRAEQKAAKAERAAEEAVSMLMQGILVAFGWFRPEEDILDSMAQMVQASQMRHEAAILGLVTVRHDTTEAPISIYNAHIVPMRAFRVNVPSFDEWVKLA